MGPKVLPSKTAVLLLAAMVLPAYAKLGKKKIEPTVTPLDRYIEEALAHGAAGNPAGAASGSLYSPVAPFADLGRDPKARFVDDMVTILVSESTSAVASGTVKSARQSSAKAGINALGGKLKAAGPLVNLADLSGQTSLDGQATTTRQSTLTTTLSARVTHVLPNGYLVVEGTKELQLNSERQVITVRGVVRPTDITPGNVVSSDHLGQLEARINGKGVIGDATRRPFILYRLLMGLLPF